MREGGGKMKPCNITLHGPPGVGKTSLKRVILGQPPLSKEKQNGTPIIENAARAVNTSRFTANGKKLLAEVNNHDLIKMLAKKAKSIHLNRKKPKEPDSTQQQQHIPVSVIYLLIFACMNILINSCRHAYVEFPSYTL